MNETKEYTQRRKFESVIDKVKITCANSKINVNEHFSDIGKTDVI